jgi:hypothetical protein
MTEMMRWPTPTSRDELGGSGRCAGTQSSYVGEQLGGGAVDMTNFARAARSNDGEQWRRKSRRRRLDLYSQAKTAGERHVRAACPAGVAAGVHGRAWKEIEDRRRRREVASYVWRRFQINYRNATATILRFYSIFYIETLKT